MLQSLTNPGKTGTTGSLTIHDITAEAAQLPDYDGHEIVLHGIDRRRGLDAIVAIHDSTLGKAFGGTRIWQHDTFETALSDVLRLSRGMTAKAAISGLPLGGGKAVIIADPQRDKTHAMLEAYAEMLQALDGIFATGEDVGVTLADADFLRARTPNVSGTTIGGSGNPAPFTAQGVYLGIKAAVHHRFGHDMLAGKSIAVQGLGSVGWALCEKLHADGARLTVADIDAARVEAAVTEFSARKAAADAILAADTDVFAPCALGGVLSAEIIPVLRAEIVAGSANNQLATNADADRLAARGVLYAPDYVINAGGLINAAFEVLPGGYDRTRAEATVARIPATLDKIFRDAAASGRTTEAVAAGMAEARIAAAA
ncbi:Glu/Leu/Phe/Val dehydrogenase dimerization domain-containing protein [Oricola sp.]|uniref:Glu/Leu/Phe/Val dehydrogenase family protein n=1 Tax=Oricola sp. TaxID=1979950 RepID=UPI003BAD64E1